MLKSIINKIMNPDGSISVDDPGVISSFTSNSDFPFLVSFSRTGSHWLRMVMELYFEKPALVRIFYFKDANDFTCYHTHDMDLELERKNVIYLYRDPVETVYSQLRYYKEDTSDQSRRSHWVDLYARHLSKWLIEERFTEKKTVLTYEGMKSNMAVEFEKLCLHLQEQFDAEKLLSVQEQISKEELKKKTAHDKQVVNLSGEYNNARAEFQDRYSKDIYSYVLDFNPELSKWSSMWRGPFR